MYMSSEKDENNTSKLVCAEAVHEFRTKHQAKFTQVLNLSTISEEKSSKKDVLCWCSGCFLVGGGSSAPHLLSSSTPFGCCSLPSAANPGQSKSTAAVLTVHHFFFGGGEADGWEGRCGIHGQALICACGGAVLVVRCVN
jgi:hypothetical protein